ncbi:hypothetical protein BRC88_02105 [Halobacteriales archaeon QS_4_69_225]|nr:MAG: hypothetical protein BRC88_02105 [Halobacteriales archaeon QS_4_69_225]
MEGKLSVVSGNDRTGGAARALEAVGLDDVHPWVFLVHAVIAVGAFGLATFGLLRGEGIGAIPLFGVGILILLMGRSAGRIAARR